DTVTLGDHGSRSNQRSVRRIAIFPPDRIRRLPFGTAITLLRAAPPIVTDLHAWPARKDASQLKTDRKKIEALLQHPTPNASVEQPAACGLGRAPACHSGHHWMAARAQEDAMSMHTQTSVSGFIASDPQLSETSKGDARFYARFGQEHYRREDDGSFTELETTFH